MSVGIITTFLIHEPKVQSKNNHYKTTDYLQLVLVFAISTTVCRSAFEIGKLISDVAIVTHFYHWFAGCTFVSSVMVAVAVIEGLVKTRLINQQVVVVETWLSPFFGFFQTLWLESRIGGFIAHRFLSYIRCCCRCCGEFILSRPQF